MRNQTLSPAEKTAGKYFFRDLRLSLELKDLKAENKRLHHELLKLEALWQQERRARKKAERRLERLRGTQGA